MAFQRLGGRQVEARFDGGTITSDAGALLLTEVEQRTAILEGFAGCFTDHRDPGRIRHTVTELVSQRVYGIALGYEDLVDHDTWRTDPLLGVLVGRAQPGASLLAGKSTLNRLELTLPEASAAERYKKVVLDTGAVDRLLVDVFLAANDTPPKEIVLDLDATDDPLHGRQEGRFFHGYYGCYCYLPLYIFCGEHLLCARLRTSDKDGAAGSVEELDRIVAQIRAAWPATKILIRADSGFCREALMAFCEEREDVDFVLGLARNPRLEASIERVLEDARAMHILTGRPARLFRELRYRTLDSWSRERRVVAKAEHLDKGANPRFIVTSLSREQIEGKALYERVYCARGDMENRIKEQQLYLFADRTSAATMRANQIRLIFSSVAYLLLCGLRRIGLAGTSMARAQCHTIRNRLLKIGARIRITARRIWISMASGCPVQDIFQLAHARLKPTPL
jgi:hypothetical protein